MRQLLFSPLLYLLIVIGIFYSPVILHGMVPAPADTIVGLYNPFRDFYSDKYPRGIPFKNSLITDPVRQQYPWKFLSVESLKHTSLPLWNPYSFSGTPLLANFQSGVFYPLNLIFIMLPFVPSWTIFIISQSLLTGVFMFLYLRNLRLHVFAQFLGSVVFTFCGFSTAWLEWGSIVSTLLWLPLLLLCIDRILEKGSKYWIMLLFIAEVCAVFAGHLQTLLYVLFVSHSYLFARVVYQSNKEARKSTLLIKRLLPFGIVFASVLVLTSMQWIPTARFIGESARSVDQLDGWKHDGWFIPWQHLMQFLIPDYFGNPTTGNYWGVWNYGEFIGYIGIIPFIFALLALCLRRDKKTYFFGVVVLVSLLFATPNPIAKLPYVLNLPFFSSTQPTRLMAVIDLSLSILSALGFDYFLKNRKKALVPIIFVAGLILMIVISTKFSRSADVVEHLSVIASNLRLPVILFIITCVTISGIVLIKHTKVQTLLIIIILVLSAADLLRFSQKFISFSNAMYLYPTTASIEFLQHHIGNYRMMTSDDRIFASNFSIMYHLQSIDGYDPLYLRRYGELMSASNRGVPDISAPFGFNRIVTAKRLDSSVVDILGVKYILSLTDLHDSKLSKVFQEGETRIYENRNTFARAFFVAHVRKSINKADEILPYFSPSFDLHQRAVVEDDQNILTQTEYASGSAVTITSYTPDLIKMRVKAADTSFLVLTDMYYPTWHATLYTDTASQPLALIRTDYAFRGMVVPKGSWTIEMKPSLF